MSIGNPVVERHLPFGIEKDMDDAGGRRMSEGWFEWG